jgi:hypothetical protein
MASRQSLTFAYLCRPRFTTRISNSNAVRRYVHTATVDHHQKVKEGEEKDTKQSSKDQDMTKHKKTAAERDEELRLKMEGIAGDGGESGVEFEDGQPVAMKRSVKNNMFRYI